MKYVYIILHVQTHKDTSNNKGYKRLRYSENHLRYIQL